MKPFVYFLFFFVSFWYAQHTPISVFMTQALHLVFILSTPDVALCLSPLTRYSREPGRKGTPALHNDHPADQPARAASGCPRRTEEACRLTDGETEAANGVSSSAAGAGNCSLFSFLTSTVSLFFVPQVIAIFPSHFFLLSFRMINPIKYICNKLSLDSISY